MVVAALSIYAGVMTVICVLSIYGHGRTLQIVRDYRNLVTALFTQLEGTRVTAGVLSLWERDREEQAERAWLS